MSHLPSASLGQYASLSFVVIGRGRGQKTKGSRQKKEDTGQRGD